MIALGNNSKLPQGWAWTQARDVIDVRDGTHDSPKYQSTGVPLVTSKNLVDGSIDFSTCQLISESDHLAISKRSAVDDGDILYAMIGTIGNPIVVRKEFEFSIKNVALFKFQNSNVYNRYFFHFLNSNLVRWQFQRNSRGGTQKFVSLGNIRDLQIPLPPLEEQKRIAAILDKADAIRRKRQQAIELCDQFLRSVFLDMFGDPVTNPKGWDSCKLSELCDLKNGFAFKSSSYVKSSATLNCRMSSIRPSGNFDVYHNMKYLPDEFYDQYSEYRLFDEDVVIAMTDLATEAKILGVPTIVQSKGFRLLQNQRVGKLTLLDGKQISFIYLQAILNWKSVRQYFQKFAGGGLQINLGKHDLLSIEIMVPPLHLQREFEKIVNEVSAMRETLIKDSHAQSALFNSLSQQAFNGELAQSKAA